MLKTVFQDLVKPQWRKVLVELKLTGGLPVSDLARQVGASYMAVKQQCEELKKLGYLGRTRVPRTAVGRPEIFYQLTARADGLFPDAGSQFTLDLLAELKVLYGESAPDQLLFHYFEKQLGVWFKRLEKFDAPLERVTKLAALRTSDGGISRCGPGTNGGLQLEEYHNPLQRIFDSYPRAILMEQRMLEQLVGCRVVRREVPTIGPVSAHVIFEISEL